MNLSTARLYGNVLSNASVAGLTLSETSYASNLKLPKHSHEEAYFCFVLEGGFTEVYGGRRSNVLPWLILPRQSRQRIKDEELLRRAVNDAITADANVGRRTGVSRQARALLPASPLD